MNINQIYKEHKIWFNDAEHKYTDEQNREYTSVTTLLHDYKPVFDKGYWLKYKSMELGLSEKTIEKEWNTIRDEACDRGTKTHNTIEEGIKEKSLFYKAVRYAKKNDNSMVTVADMNEINDLVSPLNLEEFKEKTENKYPRIYEIFQFYLDKGYKIYSEIGIFLPQLLISGTIDVLLLKDDCFQIGDWKTNRNGLQFTAGYWRKDKSTKPAQETDVWVETYEGMLPPVSHLPNCNGSLYGLQVSLYAYMVECVLNIPCVGIWLCHLNSAFELNKYNMPMRFKDGYHVIDGVPEKVSMHKMQYLKAEINSILEDRKKIILAGL